MPKLFIIIHIKSTFHHSLQGGPKNDATCFCQNFIKSPPNFIIFGIQIAKVIKLC